MKPDTVPRFASLCLLLVFFLAASGVPEAQEGDVRGGKAWIIPIRGDIGPSLTAFVLREAKRALSDGAEFLIFEIDTFGGRVDSALQITSFIMSVEGARTVAWVNNGSSSLGVSWSAGALIAFSCGDIYMAGGTSMGAASPVTASPGGAAEAAGEKAVAAVRSQMAALAERNGHPVGLALAMVDVDVELWEVLVDGKVSALTAGELERAEKEAAANGGVPDISRVGLISPAGKLLSLTAGEAERYGLASGLAASREELLVSLGAAGDVTESSPGAADALVSFLTSGPVQVILILLGLVMIFLEIQTPGFGIPGITAIFAFLVVFGTSALLGRVGSLEIILFLVGVSLLAVEIFITPGFGVMGISGILLIGVSLVFSMQDFVIPRFDWEWGLLGRNVLVVAAGLAASVCGIALLALAGPKIKMFDALTLKAQITGTAGGPDPDSETGKAFLSGAPEAEEENLSLLAGKIGVADTVLRPSGRALIDGKVYAVEADGEFVDSGRGIVVTRVRGNRIIVRRV